jgi:hypothetical protein
MQHNTVEMMTQTAGFCAEVVLLSALLGARGYFELFPLSIGYTTNYHTNQHEER